MERQWKGTVKYNGNHYYSGDSVIGLYKKKDGKHYITDIIKDEFGNEFPTELEVFEDMEML